MGVARKSMVISDEEKRNTAFHEIGHALGFKHPENQHIPNMSTEISQPFIVTKQKYNNQLTSYIYYIHNTLNSTLLTTK